MDDKKIDLLNDNQGFVKIWIDNLNSYLSENMNDSSEPEV